MLTDKEQRAIIKLLLDGGEKALDPAEFVNDLWRGCYQAIATTSPGERWFALSDHLTQFKNSTEIWEQIRSIDEHPPAIAFSSYADMDGKLPPISFLWKDWIANGFLTTLVARGGTGKSLLAMDWAKRVIQGEKAPDGTEWNVRSRNVVVVEAESVPQISLERARKWDIELERLYPMLPPLYGSIDLFNSDHRDQLVEMVNALTPGLVVIDSLGSATSKGLNAKEDVLPIMNFLAHLAYDAQCALLLIHHTRKAPTVQPSLPGMPMSSDDATGSAYIANASRIMIGLDIVQNGPAIDRNAPRRMQVIKTNFYRYPPPMGCYLLKGQASGFTYGDAPEAYREPTDVDLCAQWLLELLQDAGEPMRPKEILELAKGENYSRATLYRAKSMLGDQIENTENPNSPENMWALS